MADKTWKVFERKVAAFWGGERNPLSGSTSRHTGADVIHPSLYIEARQRATLATVTWAEEALKGAKNEDKEAGILALHRKGDRRRYYVFEEQDAETVAVHILQLHGWDIEL